jgi:hypothetical protein
MLTDDWMTMKRKERETPIKLRWLGIGFAAGLLLAFAMAGGAV